MSAAVHNHTDRTANRAQNAGMASIIPTQPSSLGSSVYSGQQEAGARTRFVRARLPVGASESTTTARQTIVARAGVGGGSSATRVPRKPRRKATHVTHDDAPVLPGISPLTTGTMPRAEDDQATWAGSYEFRDRPGSGRHTADRLEHF